ncbi:hypothetical protein [Psychromonas sp. 14N.309.X.WAT.B.A12]|uniref:hypothetical protein n=1 Tax=unclassified Psychromonas TaxID=2614957 RepID=UPI0025AEE46A|nr:hypothetical protein [Psychromonas sp. 14N.309.X.WAT.B.A12]MDN2663569.1 hypothetical protein [Psychromonas sp. 14N.309.X.WAT.B.A12]
MLIVDYQSKSYFRFLSNLPQIALHKTRFLITFNGGDESQLSDFNKALTSETNSGIQSNNVIEQKASEEEVAALFSQARDTRDILIFEKADRLFDKKTAVKASHERDNGFDLNNLFKQIAKHNGIIVLAPQHKQILSASMSTKMDVMIRFK